MTSHFPLFSSFILSGFKLILNLLAPRKQIVIIHGSIGDSISTNSCLLLPEKTRLLVTVSVCLLGLFALFFGKYGDRKINETGQKKTGFPI